MLKVLVFTLAAISLGIGLSLLSYVGGGSIVIQFADYYIETTLWAGLAILIISLAGLFLLYKAVKIILGSYGKSLGWIKSRKTKKSQRKMHQGLIQFFEEDWSHAKTNILHAAKTNESPLLHYITAAHSAHQLGSQEEAKTLLNKAARYANHDNERALVQLSHAKLQLANKQYEGCLATLNAARKSYPQHRALINLLKTVYLQLSDWSGLNGLLDELKQLKLLSPAELENFESKIRYENLKVLGQTKDINTDDVSVEHIESHWQKLNKKYKGSPQFILLYAQLLLEKNEHDKAEVVIRVALAKYWNEDFANLYGRIHGSDTQQQLKSAERWLKDHDQSPGLLLTMARLCIRLQQWEKAEGFLNASLYLTPSFDAYIELANLYAHQGNHQKSVETYQQALQQNQQLPQTAKLNQLHSDSKTKLPLP